MVRRGMRRGFPSRSMRQAARRFVAADGAPVRSLHAADAREDAAIAEVWDAIGGIDAADDVASASAPRRPLRQTRQISPRMRRTVGRAAAAGVALAVAGAGGAAWLDRPTVYDAAVGERRVVALADGSQVTLNTDTRIAVRLDGHRRQVDLIQGEAFFHVAKLAGAAPFFVTADAARVRVTGTQFNVRRRPKGAAVDVLEGHVRVGPKRDVGANGLGVVALGAAEGVDTDAAGRPGPRRPADLTRVLYWRAGQVFFQRRPLGQAVAEMNRYSRTKLVVTDAGVAELPVSGVFRAGAVTSFAQALQALYGVQAIPKGDTVALSRPATTPPLSPPPWPRRSRVP